MYKNKYNIYIYYIYPHTHVSSCPGLVSVAQVLYIYIHIYILYLYIWLTISSCYGSIPLTSGLIGRDGGLSTLCHSCGVCLSAEGAKNVSCPWLSPLRGWSSLTISLTDKFVCIYIYIYIYIYTYYNNDVNIVFIYLFILVFTC